MFDAMNAVRFVVDGKAYSYGAFYRGFGLSCTVSILFSAFLAWHLGKMARSAPSAIGALSWMFLAVQLAGVMLSLLYFGPPPAVFSALVTALLGWAAWLVRGKAVGRV